MNKIFKNIRRRLGYFSSKELEKTVDIAVDKVINEHRMWKQNVDKEYDYSNRRESVAESHDDRFSLYESRYETKKKGKDEEGKDFSIIESFTGGWHPQFDTAYDQSVEQLHRMQQVTLSKYFSDPHCRSIIENWLNYTIGGGIQFNIDNEKVKKVVDDFRRNNGMESREKDIVKMSFIEGEVFLVYYVSARDGDTKIRRIRPQEIADIETHPEDVETIFSYHWYYTDSRPGTTQSYSVDLRLADIEYDNYKQESQSKGVLKRKNSQYEPRLKRNTEIQFIKMGLDNELRGRVPLQPVLRFLKYYEDWLVDRIILNHERSKVVWIKSVKGRGQGEWGKNSGVRASKSPKGGVMLVESDNETYRIESPELNANEAKEDGMAILHTIGAGSNMPLHVLNQRADMTSYASIRKSDTPFSQFIRGSQQFFKPEFERMYREVIENKVKAGKLPKTISVYDYSQEDLKVAFDIINEGYLENRHIDTIKEEVDKVLDSKPKKRKIKTVDVPLGIEFPEVLREDLKAQADVLKIHKDIGIASLATLAAKAGYNWKEELHNKMVEKDFFKQNDPVDPKKGDEEDNGGDKNDGEPSGSQGDKGDDKSPGQGEDGGEDKGSKNDKNE